MVAGSNSLNNQSSYVAEFKNLTVNFGSFTAVKELTANFSTGCVGLLGPNGAGKSTLLKTILGFIKPAGGTGTVFGYDVVTEWKQIRQLIGYMPEQDCHIPGMSAVQYVAFAGELAGIPKAQSLRRAHEVLEYCGLGEARYRNVETYSTGMKQRIKLAQALVHGPRLLLLDEPTNGLDPKGREDMLDLVRSVSHGKNVNVIVSSHLLPDIERTCDNVVVVTQGQVRASGAIKELKKLDRHPVDVDLRDPSTAFQHQIEQSGGSVFPLAHSKYRVILAGEPAAVSHQVMQAAIATGAQVRGITLAQRTLEEVFLSAIGHQSATSSQAPPPVATPPPVR